MSHFRHRLRVRYNECDPQGVVFNANYLTYFDITMGELWRELGGYQAMVDAGVDMVVAEATIRYLAPLRFDDEIEVVARDHPPRRHLDDDGARDRGRRRAGRRGRAAARLHRDRRRLEVAYPGVDPLGSRSLLGAGELTSDGSRGASRGSRTFRVLGR